MSQDQPPTAADVAAMAEAEKEEQQQQPTAADIAAMAEATGVAAPAAAAVAAEPLPTAAEVAQMEAAVARPPPPPPPLPPIEEKDEAAVAAAGEAAAAKIELAQLEAEAAVAEAAAAALAAASKATSAAAMAAPAAPAPAEQEPEPVDPLAIGNLVSVFTTAYGEVVGRVIYRSADLVRLMPQEVSDRAFDFPLVDDGQSFSPELGVASEIDVLEVNPYKYYVDFLGVKPGEFLEFFTIDGEVVRPAAEVAEVIKTRTKDSVLLADGTVIKFAGRGPPAPIGVIRVRTAMNMAAAAAPPAPEAVAEEIAAAERQASLVELLRSIQGPAAVEVIPSAERTYPDSIQREEQYEGLVGRLIGKQKSNQRRLRAIEREVDLAVALKNTVAARDEVGRITGITESVFDTLESVVKVAENPLSMAIPIVTAAQVLNLEKVDDKLAFKETDVAPRDQKATLLESDDIANMYLGGSLPAGLGQSFVGYMYDLLGRGQEVLRGPAPTSWKMDQDIIRTAGLDEPVQGLSLPEDPAEISLMYLIPNTVDRYRRVITQDLLHLHRAYGPGPQIAVSDPTEVSGYVILPAKAALKLRPPTRTGDLPTALLYSTLQDDENLPTVATALRDLYVQKDSADPLHAYTVGMDEARNLQIADWLNATLKYAIHPVDSLGPRGPRLLALLDSMGLGARDLSPAVTGVVDRWVRQSQKLWQKMLAAERERVKAVLEAQGERTFQTVTGEDSPAWKAIREDELLKDLLEDIQLRNPAIFGSETMLTASLLREAQGDATPLVWSTLAKMDGRDIPIDPVAASASLAASRAYTLRRRALRDFGILSLRAEPDINTCVHVRQLEAIRNMADVIQRARLLRDFIEEFQGGRTGDWITCTLCKKECICFHEVMELEALAQPARMESIKKQMLVRFGGDRYEGRIICRNCGQPLQDIDYDEHVEFDDDGNPITGRSVLTEEQMEGADGPTETTWRRAAKDLVAEEIHFPTQSQRETYTALKEVLEKGGMTAAPEVIRQIVKYADLYIARLPSREKYDEGRMRALKAAAKVIPAPYDAVVNMTRFSAIGAVLTLMIQIADPPITVLNPFPLCRFSRRGFPADAEDAPAAMPKSAGESALEYVVCVMAAMDRPHAPWNTLLWNEGTTRTENMETRRGKVWPIVLGALRTIYTGDARTGPLSFTPEIRSAVVKAQTDAEALRARAMVSTKDQLRVGFRPEPFPPRTARPVIEKDPVPDIVAALAAGESVADMAPPIAGAMRQQALAVISELHAAAAADVESRPQKPTTVNDSTCCAATLTEADAGAALLGAPEAGRLLLARDLVRGGIPTATNAGTHLWPRFDAPIAPPVEQTVEEGVLFKLFLKYCYVGPTVGEPHEFSLGNTCRQCGLALGKSLDLIDFGAEGASILSAQQGDLRVEVTPPAFNALSDAVRRRRVILERPPGRQEPWVRGLLGLVATARERADLGADQGVRGFADALASVLVSLEGREMMPIEEAERLMAWAPLNKYMDDLKEEVMAKVGPMEVLAGGAQARARAREARIAWETFEAMTDDPFIEGPRALQEYWCAKPEAAGAKYEVTAVNGARWFKDMSSEHNRMINGILASNASWFNGTVTDAMTPVLKNLGKSSGPLLRVWIRDVRAAPVADGPWTVAEAQMVLRCIVLQSWRDAVVSTSWMYAGGGASAEKDVTARAVADWTRALMFHAKQQFVRFSKDRIKQILQQRAEMERTSVVEEFKDLKDDDLRASYMMMKQLKIGRWARGANIQKLDADQFDFEQRQLEKMGMGAGLQMAGPVMLESMQQEMGEVDTGYNVSQAADGDDY